ncbi:M23 family metallopeptidase [Streptomyces sp. HSG2]|uniref:M23 family metallopeptidase n=1 Tax=Streptomyces sp. HSG2 TaxID=2797167 RepID=UPI0019043674|nr:M23 family metallopeptidase [Streptomyces sp. HSG2]
MNDRHPSGTLIPPDSASDSASGHPDAQGDQAAPSWAVAPHGGHEAAGHTTGFPTVTPYVSGPLLGARADGPTATPEPGHAPHGIAYGWELTQDYDPGAYDADLHRPDPSHPHIDAGWGVGVALFDVRPPDAADAHALDVPHPGLHHTGAHAASPWQDPTEAWGDLAQGQPTHDAPYSDIAADRAPAHTPDDVPTGDGDSREHPPFGAYPPDVFSHPSDAPPDDMPAAAHGTPLPAAREEPYPAEATARAAGARATSRSRRRRPARRSTLLTIALPSACVVGVAGMAAASVGGLGEDDESAETTARPDAPSVTASAANDRLDDQLAGVSAGATDFADRASRTQERLDLAAQQAAEKKRAAEEAARKERLRPKFALPVAQQGLSAYYGQSGINWMSVHSGIDFPVSYGTSVKAATDGTVRTQYNSAYGNMMVVTAKDGTETWYCHLSSYQVPSGSSVKAGDQIAYSGNSGNSTGPHLHFEVRPGGGSPIDPLAWLRSHDLEPV